VLLPDAFSQQEIDVLKAKLPTIFAPQREEVWREKGGKSVLLPDLPGMLGWDSSHLYSSGTLSVIPEPATPAELNEFVPRHVSPHRHMPLPESRRSRTAPFWR